MLVNPSLAFSLRDGFFWRIILMRLRLYRGGLGGHSKRGNGATARAWGLLSPLGVRYDDRLAVLFDNQLTEAFLFNRAIIVTSV